MTSGTPAISAMRYRPVRRLALHRQWSGGGVKGGPGLALLFQTIGKPADDLVIFGMDQHDGLFGPCRLEHVEDLRSLSCMAS